MKTKTLLTLVFALIAGVIFISCDEDDDTQKPVISNLEVGHNDTIHVAEGVHLDFEVSDNEKLDYYRITIHPEEDHKKSLTEVHWEFDSTFTEISGLKNYTVHHHDILVPENAELGEYHFHLSVADEAGNLAEVEKELIMAAEDGVHHDH